MLHDFNSSGYAFRLRPVTDADAGLIANLRADPVLGRFLHRSSPRVEDQLKWLTAYYARPGDFYFVIERRHNDRVEGVIAIYDVDYDALAGEWGRWILRSGSLAAVESALLIYRMAFEVLQLKTVYCRTVKENESVVAFHDSCGIADKKLLKDHFLINGALVDAIEHRVGIESWIDLRARLEKLAVLTARRIDRG